MNPSQWRMCLLMLLAMLGQLNAQQAPIRLKGIVIEAETGLSVPYTTIRVKDKPLGTITDEKGRFSFKLPDNFSNVILIFTCVGYEPKEVAVSQLRPGIENRVELKESVRELGQVTVVDEKQLSALTVLKRAIERIPKNYRSGKGVFDAYYRERITENGAVIRYADAAITIEQGAYDGKKYEQGFLSGAEWKSAKRYGTWLAAYPGIGHVGDRLHDHFGHRTAPEDKVLIHQTRVSQNLTRAHFVSSIEGGPLSTLSKDLVKYLAHFMNKKHFRHYIYELTEVPDGKGNWDYIINFKPKKPATIKDLEDHILSGKIRIQQETYVIKDLSYFVSQDYRKHICNLLTMDVKHYGYEVEVLYEEKAGQWEIEHLSRKDEFIYEDTIHQTTIPYAAISEIWPGEEATVSEVPIHESFSNKDHHSLQCLYLPYAPEFWKAYALRYPQAIIGEKIRKDMEGTVPLEDQFAHRVSKDEGAKPPKAMASPEIKGYFGHEVNEAYGYLENERRPDFNQYLKAEKVYTAEAFLSLESKQEDLEIELSAYAPDLMDSAMLAAMNFDTWAALMKSPQAWRYQLWTFKPDQKEMTKVPITLLFMGKDKDRWLKKRPMVVKMAPKENRGNRMPFDPLDLPLLNSGFALAYVHTDLAGESRWFWKSNLKQKEQAIRELTDAVKFMKASGYTHPEKVFVMAEGFDAAITLAAIQREAGLFQGALLDNGLYDLLAYAKINAETQKVATQPKFYAALNDWSPYQQEKQVTYPNMALYAEQGHELGQALKFMANLRAKASGDKQYLLLTSDNEGGDEKSAVYSQLRKMAAQLSLIYQWLDEYEAIHGRER